MHEIVHIFVGRDDFFNDRVEIASEQRNRREESFCNAVAGEIMAPREAFRSAWTESAEPFDAKLHDLSDRFKGTVPAMAYRALVYNLISEADYERFIDDWRQRYRETTAQPSMRKKQKITSEGDIPIGSDVLALSRLGPPVIGAIVDSVRDGRMPYTQAFQLTGTKLPSFRKLVEKATGRRWSP